MTERLQELNNLRENMVEYEYTHKKEHLLTRLKRLIPGGCCSLQAMCTKNGISTRPEDIAECLKEHWSKVFSRKNVNLQYTGAGWAGMGSPFEMLALTVRISNGP